jgi:MFS family permease
MHGSNRSSADAGGKPGLFRLAGDLTACERQTLPRWLVGMVFQGVWWAGYLLVPFVLAKSLAAPPGLITLVVMMDTGGMLLALHWGHLLGRGDRRRVIFWGGMLGRLSLGLAMVTHSASQFVGLLALVYFCAALVYPAQNGVLQHCFRPALQGRFWGYGALVQNGVAVVTSIFMGIVLDRAPQRFGAVYAIIGACGFLYMWILSRLPQPEPAGPAVRPGRLLAGWSPLRLLRALVGPLFAARATFRRDRAYGWYEANFMSYGMAFLMLQPMLPRLLADRLGLAYTEISTARIMIAQMGVALLGPAAGRLMDRHRPARLCQLAFGCMVLFPAGLFVAGNVAAAQPERLVYLAFGLYAVGMAGVNVTWNVGSISFAPPGEGSHYQGIHVSLVGIRGVLGPALGFAVYRLSSMNAVFVLAALFFAAASVSSGSLARWRHLRSAAAGQPITTV